MPKLTSSEDANHRNIGIRSAVGTRGDSKQSDQRARWLALGDVAIASKAGARREFRELQEFINDNRRDFLHVDLDLALTMVQIAFDADRDSPRRERNIRNARKAYDTVLKFRDKVHASAAQKHCLRRKLSHLRLCLEDLGERFDPLARVA